MTGGKDMDQGTTTPASASSGHPAAEDAAAAASAIDLKQFCGDDDFRPYIRAPFRYKGHVYATDGRVLIRVADNQSYQSSDKVAVEKVLDLDAPREFLRAPATKQFPKKRPVEKVRCPDCDGRGTDHDCERCECTCYSCKGSGSIEEKPEVSTIFGGQIFDLEYVRLLYTLPDLEIAPNPADAPMFTPLFFRFTGGVGALMPMREQYKIHVDISPSKDAAIT